MGQEKGGASVSKNENVRVIGLCVLALFIGFASMFRKSEDEVRAKVPFAACLEKATIPVEVDDFYSTATKCKSAATK